MTSFTRVLHLVCAALLVTACSAALPEQCDAKCLESARQVVCASVEFLPDGPDKAAAQQACKSGAALTECIALADRALDKGR